MITIAEKIKSKDVLREPEVNCNFTKSASLNKSTSDEVNCEEKMISGMVVENVDNIDDSTTVMDKENCLKEHVIDSNSLDKSDAIVDGVDEVELIKHEPTLNNLKEITKNNLVDSKTINSKDVNENMGEISSNELKNVEKEKTDLVNDIVPSIKDINGLLITPGDLGSTEADPLLTFKDSSITSPPSHSVNISSIVDSPVASPAAASVISNSSHVTDTAVASPAAASVISDSCRVTDTSVASPDGDRPVTSSNSDIPVASPDSGIPVAILDICTPVASPVLTNGLNTDISNGNSSSDDTALDPLSTKIKVDSNSEAKADYSNESISDLIIDIDDAKQNNSYKESTSKRISPVIEIIDDDVLTNKDKDTDMENIKTGKKRVIEEDPSDSCQALKKVRIVNNSSTRMLTQDFKPKTGDTKPIVVKKRESESSDNEEKQKMFKSDICKKQVPLIPRREHVDRLTANELENSSKLKKSSKLHRISRKDLENMVVQLFADKLLYEHEIGRQRDLCKRLEATLEGNRKKASQFHKEIEDLRKVTNRLQSEYNTRKGQVVTPVKVKRSVGIHVTPNIISKGVTSSESVVNNVKYISPSKAKRPIERPQKTEKKYKTLAAAKEAVSQNLAKVPIAPSIVNSPKTVLVPVSQVTTTAIIPSKPKTGFIDLTDDEDAGKSLLKTALANGANMVAIPRQAINLATSGQFVALPQSSVNSLLLVPQSALVVTSMANTLQNVSGVSSTIRTPILNPSLSIGMAHGTISQTNANTPRLILTAASPIAQKAIMAASSLAPRHPAELPIAPPQQTAGLTKNLPPQPILNLSHKDNTGIVLLWKMAKTDEHEAIASYQLYAYQEGSAPPVPSLWKRVGSVKALELPMACTLTQFMSGHTYHFAVRAVDIRNRLGPFSEPKSIRLKK